MLGTLLIRWSPDPELAFVIKQLHSLGLKTEVVGGFHAADSKEPTLRHQRVIDLQQSGATVAYLGDVIDDILQWPVQIWRSGYQKMIRDSYRRLSAM